MSERKPLSIDQQADLIEDLISRCTMRDGSTAGEVFLRLEKSDVADLGELANRLRRIAPHEDRIRRMVTGK